MAPPEPPRNLTRLARSLFWVATVGLSWGGLMWLSRQPGFRAVVWTNRLFGGAVLLTYAASVGLPLAWCRSRLGRFRWIATHLCVLAGWGVLELLTVGGVNARPLADKVIAGSSAYYDYATRFVLDRELMFKRPPNTRWAGPTMSDLECPSKTDVIR